MSLEKCSIDKIISGTKEEKKKEEDFFSEKFSNPKIEKIERLELKKSAEQIEMINLVNDETNKLLEEYGLEKFDIDPDNIHLLDENAYENFRENRKNKENKGSAVFKILNQSIIINQDVSFSKTLFVHRLFHEMIHFKSRQEIHISKDKKVVGKVGILINPKLELDADIKKEDEYFNNLCEAITEELSVRFQKNVIRNHPDFEEENQLIKEYIEKRKLDGVNLNIDEILAVLKKTFYSSNKKEKTKFYPQRASYKKQRVILNVLVDKLYNKNQDKFEDREEVFDLFAKSVFTGNIVSKGSWGRLVDETFGSGTLQKIAERDYNPEELKDFIENLI